MPPVTFGPFTFDAVSGQLRRGEAEIPLQTQPARVLALLTSRPGELVTRCELRTEIWGDTWVNFDQGLNYCIRQVRLALEDDARVPRYVQTLPQRGYRFVAPLEAISPRPDAPLQHRRWLSAAVAALALFAGLTLGLKAASVVVLEQSGTTNADLASHLKLIHVAGGTWTHHIRPALENIFTLEAPQASP